MTSYFRFFFVICLALAGSIVYLWWNPGARELVFNALAVVAGFIFTPFVLESSFFVLGCFILAFVLQWQRDKDGDEWIEITQDSKDEE